MLIPRQNDPADRVPVASAHGGTWPPTSRFGPPGRFTKLQIRRCESPKGPGGASAGAFSPDVRLRTIGEVPTVIRSRRTVGALQTVDAWVNSGADAVCCPQRVFAGETDDPLVFRTPKSPEPAMTVDFTRTAICAVATLVSFAIAPNSRADDVWKAGVASAVITPQQPMQMAGYASRNKPSEGIAQDLFIKALALGRCRRRTGRDRHQRPHQRPAPHSRRTRGGSGKKLRP